MMGKNAQSFVRSMVRILGGCGLVFAMMLVVRCAPVTDTPDGGGTTPPETRAPAPTLTYHKDVRGILEKSCLGCHKEGSIGPFPLATYQDVYSARIAVKASVASGNMPPWPADEKSCRPYLHSMALSDKEKETITKWIDEGAPEGDASTYTKPTDVGVVGLDRVDLSLKMPEPYEPHSKLPAGQPKPADDYRCFVLDWPKDKATFITGFQIKAGNPKIVHHVIAYIAEPKNKQQFIDLDNKEDGPGYTCYGGSGGPANWAAAWAPGKPGGSYPEGTGVKVNPGSAIIIQVHYNTLTSNPTPDQTAVELKLEDKVDNEAYIVPISHTKWMIPKGETAFKTFKEFENDIGKQFKIDINVHSASLHMHLLGKSSRFYIKREDGTEECLLNIPKWDFGWQYFYDFKKPVVIRPNDKIGLECVWDNSANNQALVNGKRLSSRDVTWGDNSTDEMCLGIVYITSAGPTTTP